MDEAVDHGSDSHGVAEDLGPTLLLLEHDPAFGGAVGLDFALADGRVVGLDFRSASATLPPALLVTAERIDGRHLERVAAGSREPVQ